MSRLSASSRVHRLIVTARRPFLHALVLVALTGAGLAETPLTTAFTYQGRLLEDGVPVTDVTDGRDFLFRLYDVPTEGAVLASYSDSGACDVPVSNGLFAATIDFGTPVFTGSKRYLEVWIRDGFITGDEGVESTYSVAGDRQELTAAPNAIYAMTADKATSATSLRTPGTSPSTAVSVASDGKVGVGTTSPTATLEVSGTTKLAGATTITATTTIGSSGNALVKLGNVEMDNSSSGYIRTSCTSGDTGGVHIGYNESPYYLGVHFGADDAVLNYIQPSYFALGVNNGELARLGINNGGPAGVLHISGTSSTRTDAEQIRLSQKAYSSSGASIAVTDLIDVPGIAKNGVGFSMAANGKFDTNGAVTRIDTARGAWNFGMRTDAPTSSAVGIDGDALTIANQGASESGFRLMMMLTGNGALHLFPHDLLGSGAIPDPVVSGSSALLYVGNGGGGGLGNDNAELYARGGSDTSGTRLTSHADPSKVDPTAVTSFDDSNVPLPFSFAHTNQLVGKGCVVDMAKALGWVEKEMKKESGEEGGKVFFYYDLPQGQQKSYEDFLRDKVAADIQTKLLEKPLIEVSLGADGALPPESWETVELTEDREVEEVQVVDEIDWSTNRVVKVEKTRKVMRPFPTGQTKKQLKAEYSLVDGKLYRRATPDDVEITASDIAPAPDWVLDRAPEATSPSVDQIIEQELSKARDSYREIQTAQSSEVQAEPKSKGGN